MPHPHKLVEFAELMAGRRDIVDRVLADRDAPVVTVVSGPAGIGHTSVLSGIHAAAKRQHRPVLSLRLAPQEQNIPYHFAGRLAGELSAIRVQSGHNSRGPMHGAAVHATLARTFREHPGLVVLVDDGQWMDQPSLAMLEHLIRDLAGSDVRCVCAVRTSTRAGSGPARRAVLDRLQLAGLAQLVTLRPLSTLQVDAFVTKLIQAKPHRALRDDIARSSRGVPVALQAAIDGYRRAGSLRVVDGRAYLVGSTRHLEFPEDHPLLRPVRSLPPPIWSVAKALAVLHPLGDAVVALVSEALGLATDEVAAAADVLVDNRVLRVNRHGGWTFVIPVMATALRCRLGQYERRRLAQIAVHALWAGTAQCADPHYLPEQLAWAGRLVDHVRAADELLAHGNAAAMTDARAARWLSAAADLVGHSRGRAQALLNHAATASRHGDHSGAMRSARLLLHEHRSELSPDEAQKAEIVYLTALRGVRDFASLESVASGADHLPGGAGSGVVTRAAALCLLDRWAFAARLLGTTVPTSSAHDASASCGDGAQSLVMTMLGQSQRLLNPVDAPGSGRSGPAERDWVAAQVRMLTMVGDVNRAEQLLRTRGIATTDLPGPDQTLMAWWRGRWDEALDQAWTSIASDVLVAHQPADGAVYRAVAEILLGRGRPLRARAMIHSAQAEPVTLPYLLGPTAAAIERTLGFTEGAERIVVAALDLAARGELVHGTDELWLLYTELALERGDRDAARRGVTETSRVARALGTDLSALHDLLAHAAEDPKTDTARKAVQLARALGQPFTLARTLERVVQWTGNSASLLNEAYELFGNLDALLHRSRARSLMRKYDMTVPERAATVVESDRLLAALVAEGLPNRQLAAALQTSEKSVESRLTRLFSRLGYRSRVELAAATLTGGVPKA